MQTLSAPLGRCPHCGYNSRTDPVRQPAHSLPCGTLLHGCYVIGKILGQGGFGMTYIAWDNKKNERFCVKEYFPDGFAMRNKHIEERKTAKNLQ